MDEDLFRRYNALRLFKSEGVDHGICFSLISLHDLIFALSTFWDLIATLYALQPDTPYLCCEDLGSGRYDVAQKQFYTEDTGDKNIKQIVLNCEPCKMAKLLNECMLGNFIDI